MKLRILLAALLVLLAAFGVMAQDDDNEDMGNPGDFVSNIVVMAGAGMLAEAEDDLYTLTLTDVANFGATFVSDMENDVLVYPVQQLVSDWTNTSTESGNLDEAFAGDLSMTAFLQLNDFTVELVIMSPDFTSAESSDDGITTLTFMAEVVEVQSAPREDDGKALLPPEEFGSALLIVAPTTDNAETLMRRQVARINDGRDVGQQQDCQLPVGC